MWFGLNLNHFSKERIFYLRSSSLLHSYIMYRHVKEALAVASFTNSQQDRHVLSGIGALHNFDLHASDSFSYFLSLQFSMYLPKKLRETVSI